MSRAFVAVAVVPPGGTTDFEAYEATVLALLPAHGGRLTRRLRHTSADGGWREFHVLSFIDDGGLAAFRADPLRAVAAHLLVRSGAHVELYPVDDLTDPDVAP